MKEPAAIAFELFLPFFPVVPGMPLGLHTVDLELV